VPNTFPRTLRSLKLDGLRGWSVRLVAAALLLGAWAAWFFLASVTVFAVSNSARLEVDREVYPLEAPVSGRIAEVAAVLDQKVETDEVLFVLEADAQRLELAEEQTRSQALVAQLDVLRQELEASRESLEEWRRAAQAELEVARARLTQAESVARMSTEEEERLAVLHQQGLASEMDLVRARSDAQQQASAVEALRLSASRLQLEQRAAEQERRAAVDKLEREEAQLAGRITTTEATSARLEEQLRRRAIRTPVSGRLGEVSGVQVGSFVDEGDRLATVVPSGEIAAVADFAPREALGRIRPGQGASLRLAGFPSTQYGSITATVARVASEARNGLIRVELTLDTQPPGGVPLEHGLPGTVEVEVERVSPATLVLRALGKLIDRPVKRQPLG